MGGVALHCTALHWIALIYTVLPSPVICTHQHRYVHVLQSYLLHLLSGQLVSLWSRFKSRLRFGLGQLDSELQCVSGMVKVCGKAVSMGHLLALAAIVQMLFLVLLLPSHERDSFRHSLSQSFASSSGSLRNVFAMSNSVTKLPSFAQDSSELVLSSVLERSSTSSDMFVTTFLLSKSVLDPFEKDKTMSVKGISATSAVTVKTLIEKQSKLSYDVTGNRKSPPHFCLIKLDKSSNTKPQSVPAHFLPNRLTSDFHSNRKIDILRCPLQSILNASTSIHDYIDGHRSLEIEIYREETFLTSFDIPWRSRSTGYLFSAPPTASQLQAWHGLNRSMGPHHDQGHESLDTVHLCVANSKSKSLHHLAEFLEHHKRIGVQHVYYSLPFAWKTKSMHRILSSLSDYVNEGFLSVQSSADQYLNPNLVTSAAEGIYWHDYTERVIQINSCLYIAKGNANYVGIWDVNDLFIPSNPKFTLVDILLAHIQERLRFNSGYADKTGGMSSIHAANTTTRIRSDGAPNGTIMSRPDCFISVVVRHVYPNVVKTTEQESRRIWLSSQYDVNNLLHSTSRETGFKYFIPTELIFQGGMHTPGGCRMPSAPRVCGGPLEEGTHSNLINGFCLRRTRNDVQYNNHRLSRPNDFDALGEDFSFDDVVLQGDGSSLSHNVGGGMIYSFEDASENEVVKTQGSPMDLHNRLQTSDNIYGQYYSSLVERTLNSKSILSESLMIPIHRPLPVDLTHDVNSWEKFELRYRNNFNAIIQPDISNTALDADKTNPLSAGSLPSFVTDGSDVCLGSLIERQHDSFKLHISTFFIQHELLYMPPEGYGFLKIRNDHETQQQWKKAILAFNDTHYSHTGQRLATPRYFCRVSVKLQNDSLVNLSMKARNVLLSPYSIQGEFMPNSLTVDKNANRRVDILRCPVRHSKLIHATNLPSSAEVLTVEIYREKNFLISFEIPWVTRRTGFSLSVPKQASKFNAWQNFPQNSRRTDSRTSEEHELLKSDSQDYNDPVVHMCVPGFETHISQRSLTVYAEFLQHHILIGVNHMFVAGPYAWGGQNMANFLAAFRTFIDEGKLTVSSLAESIEEEYLYSILGATIDRDNVKVFHVSSCLYLSKGVADYVAVWDNGKSHTT